MRQTIGHNQTNTGSKIQTDGQTDRQTIGLRENLRKTIYGLKNFNPFLKRGYFCHSMKSPRKWCLPQIDRSRLDSCIF